MSMVSSTRTTSSELAPFDETLAWKPEDGLNGTLTFGLRTMAEAFDAPSDGADDDLTFTGATYSFPSHDLLHRALAPNRMAILQVMMGQGPLSIREIARRVGRDFKGVHTDLSSMIVQGLVLKAATGGVVFPYDAIRFDFGIGGAPLPTQDRSAA